MDNVRLHDSGFPNTTPTNDVRPPPLGCDVADKGRQSRYVVDVPNFPPRIKAVPQRGEAAQQELEREWITFLSANQQTTTPHVVQTANSTQVNFPRPPNPNPSFITADAVVYHTAVHADNPRRLPTLDVPSLERVQPMPPMHP